MKRTTAFFLMFVALIFHVWSEATVGAVLGVENPGQDGIQTHLGAEGTFSHTFKTESPWGAYLDLAGRITEHLTPADDPTSHTEVNDIGEFVASYLNAGPVLRMGMNALVSGVVTPVSGWEAMQAAAVTTELSGGSFFLGWNIGSETGLYGNNWGGWWSRVEGGLSISPGTAVLLDSGVFYQYTGLETGGTARTIDVNLTARLFVSSRFTLETEINGERNSSSENGDLTYSGLETRFSANFITGGGLLVSGADNDDSRRFDVSPELSGSVPFGSGWEMEVTDGGSYQSTSETSIDDVVTGTVEIVFRRKFIR